MLSDVLPLQNKKLILIIGHPGVGKTTLLNFLEKFNLPQSMQIFHADNYIDWDKVVLSCKEQGLDEDVYVIQAYIQAIRKMMELYSDKELFINVKIIKTERRRRCDDLLRLKTHSFSTHRIPAVPRWGIHNTASVHLSIDFCRFCGNLTTVPSVNSRTSEMNPTRFSQ